ncbi:hypothetical protein CVT26_013673 [Gymnopilus dilepis]|uniref:F-box domain-containing protein n=1 Tax=Gymnopilus dilepis TaxID=231916 RepID=A0A409YWJ4_9AGAR|nr:hypothetical protein CVT26_013673 [Gymnopilus dilepis]
MERASVHSLPFELHTMIIKHRPEELGWIEDDFRSPSLFPNNVANVWDVWRAVLAHIPECWPRVVFDVAKDPAPFLDAFAWSKGLVGLEVAKYNNSKFSEVHDDEEAQRVSAILDALLPHIPREAPHLEALTLECILDNVGLTKIPPSIWPCHQHSSFPRLRKLSLTAFWFLFLVNNADTDLGWLAELEPSLDPCLFISCFAFPEHGRSFLEAFMQCLSVMESWQNINLVNLSLAFEFNSSVASPEYSYVLFSETELRFRNVSRSFLSHFDFLVGNHKAASGINHLTFERCELPTTLKFFPTSNDLKLSNYIHIGDCKAGIRDTLDRYGEAYDDDLQWLGTPKGYCIRDGAVAYEEMPLWDLMQT